MRCIGEVIDKMIARIPDSEEEAKKELIRVKNAAGYKPPEMSTSSWSDLASSCRRCLGEPPYEKGSWKESVLRIFNDQEV